MFKIVGMLMVASSLTLAGFKMSMNLNCRYESLKHIKKLLIFLKGEIKYKSSMLEEAFVHLAENIGEPYGEFLLNLSDNLKNREDRRYNEIVMNNMEKLKKSCLKESDLNKFRDFFENLGYYDKETQISGLDMYVEELEISMEEALNDIKRNGKLYRMTGAAAGILICLFVA